MSQAHENLVAWQRADDLCVLVYRLTREFLSREEQFGLSAQLRRAAYSVPANVVEGWAYHSSTMRLKHVRIAVGSLAEVGYGLHLARRLGYLPEDQLNEIEPLVRKTAAPLHGLVAHLREELGSQPGG